MWKSFKHWVFGPTTEEIIFLRASKEGYKDRVQDLLNEGIDIEAKTENGCTALFLASKNNQLDVVNLLLESGAYVDERNKSGYTPLLISCIEGHIRVVEELLKWGANVNVVDKNGLTPLIRASINNHPNIIRKLVENGADVNAKSKNGRTALIFAATKNNEEALLALLEYGADPKLTDKKGKTALDLAEGREIVDILNRIESENPTTPQISDQDAKEEIKRLRKELLQFKKRCDDKNILSKLEELAASIKENPPTLVYNENVNNTTIQSNNENNGEKAGYQFFNIGQSDFAGELASVVGMRPVFLTIRITELESQLEIKDRQIEDLKEKNRGFCC